MKRLLWAAWWTGVLLVVVVFACVTFVLVTGRTWALDSVYFKPPANERPSAKIAVFGDTQKGLAGFAALAEMAKAEGVDLAIHTGDLVSHADIGHYDLAILWLQRARLEVPFRVVPGNHDIKGGEGLFESRIGSRETSFRWGPVHIVMIDNAVALLDLKTVEPLLAAASKPILLFMHVPAVDTSSKTFAPKPGYARFLEMIRKYPVRAVFSGHAHGYTRVEKDGIVFISNGVGGDSDSWQFDQKAYLTIVEADGKTIRDSAIVIEPVIGIWANIEHLAIGHVGEIVLRRPWGPPALLLLIVALILGFRRLRRKKPPEAPKKEELKLRFTTAKTSDPPDIVI